MTADPPVVRVLTEHLATMLALKLDSAVYVGGTALPGITGMNNIASTQIGGTIISGGTASVTSYPTLIKGVGLLRAANVPEPTDGYVLACHPLVQTAFEQPAGLARPDRANRRPACRGSSAQRSINVGTAYLYAPDQLAIVRRQDSTVEVDRSRLFNSDESEIRGKLRMNLICPEPERGREADSRHRDDPVFLSNAIVETAGYGDLTKTVSHRTPMTAIAIDPVSVLPDPGYRGLLAFAERVGLNLEPFQRKILRAVHRASRPRP